MNSNFKKYFSLDLSRPEYKVLSDAEKTLVKTGFKLVKQYAAQKAKATSKKTFLELLDNIEVDGYKALNDKFTEKLVKYSLTKAGVDTSDFNIRDIANPMLHNKQAFKENFNAVLAQIMTPIVPALISAEFMDWADVANIAYGDTARFVVRSNDIFYVTRMAEGIRDGSVQRLYNDELTVNPEPYDVKTTVDWYQLAAGVFDLGEFVYKVGLSFNAFISEMIISAITADIKANITASIPYFTNGFTTQKFTTLVDRLSAANNGAHIKAYGTLPALSAVIPSGTAGSTIANMQMELGEEWSKVGHIGKYMGVDLVRIPPILLPNTVNTSALFGIPSDTVFLFADGGYKPVKLVFEGQAVTIDIIPTESPDKETGLDVSMRIGMTFVAASKYGAITGVTLGA